MSVVFMLSTIFKFCLPLRINGKEIAMWMIETDRALDQAMVEMAYLFRVRLLGGRP